MAADLSGMSVDDAGRFADENDDFTHLYVRRNRLGWVRDAKFIPDCPSLDVANTQFAGHVEGAEVRLCAVLRGQVRTVDRFEFAHTPDVFSDMYASVLEDYESSLDDRMPFTVFGCWDSGDGPRRYSVCVDAVTAEHAELIARSDKTVGEFLVAAVVEGHVPVEDAAVDWATVDGEPVRPPEPTGFITAEHDAHRPWLWFAVIGAVLVVLIGAIFLIF